MLDEGESAELSSSAQNGKTETQIVKKPQKLQLIESLC